ncbi:hypothetical protein SLEP1_g35666 [Rubroshorea leprosula]|uniref:AAA+ ATPase domain-containing protein n=1 Tax=Rubroshorea leprosula TaxID=152421 RepID=A0AAV5KP68_9ROSI|nr:hypothetical protein SLEP1_g35666 [Rubroshorea leprosula]
MAEVATVAATAAGKVTGTLFALILNPIWNKITRVFKLEANVKNLKENVWKLKAEKERVLQFRDDADRCGKEVTLRVNNWLTSSDKYIGEMEKFESDTDNAKKCFARVCPNPKGRYQISKKAEEYLEAIAQLLEEAARFKIPDSYFAPSQKISTTPVQGYEEFGTRTSILNGIMEALRSASVDKIGVYGMPGVGKTILAQEVARQAEEAQLFDSIVMASVNKNPELKRIQGEIADKLGLQLHGETEFGRACQLKAYLKQKKRILVILDDIWTRLELDKLGIPFEVKKNEASSTGEEQLQCKILFTSRFLNVLSSDMRTHKDFEVGRLQDEEAWELFKKIAGNEIEKSDLQLTAMEITKECAGLPLAVDTLATALKCRSSHAWRDALRELKRPSPSNFEGISENVYRAIEMSYKHLERKDLQQTFLLSSLLGHNASIEDLMKYGIGLDLFHNVMTTGEARDKVLTLVSNLKSSSLLLNGCDDIHFDMHDIVRDVAISIASRDHHVLSLIDDNVPREWSERGALEGFKWISLQYANISELPDELECPQLTLFCFCSKDPFMKIPGSFFQRTEELRVLNFSKMHFSSLPSSICLLKSLHTLHVNECVLEDIGIIGKLMSLKVLSLSGCDIEELPMEIRQLTQLKLLDLSDCAKLKVIQPHVLASLSRLEELYLGNSFNQWGIGENGNQRNASLAELKDLHNLAALDVHVCDVQLIPEDLFSERLNRYKIFIGEMWNHWDSSFKSSKILKLELNSFNYDHSIGMLLKKTEELHLKELTGFKNVVYELDAEGFQKLKYLCVQNAAEVQHIVNSVKWVLCHAFPVLESLLLLNLNNLVTICHGQLGAMSFSRLRIITVECCNQLKNLFPFSIARWLLQLKEIRVTDCSNMVEIVDKEGQGTSNNIVEANENFELVQLRSLKLEYLPKFISLGHGNEESNNSSSNSTNPLFDKKIVLPNLEELQLSWINIKSIWSSRLSVTSSCIQNLTRLIIEGCDHLEHLLSFSMAKNLVQLRCLQIKKCKMMKEVIEPENAEEMEDLISFPKLDILNIENLENLTRFCSGNCSVEFTSLKQLFIKNCPELKGFTVNHTSTDITGGLEPLFNEKVTFPSLEILRIFQLENLRIIWHHQLPADSFCKLKSLSILSCERLLTIFPSEILERLCTSLEELEVSLCGCLEEIFDLGELNIEESHTVVDSQLRHLSICQLPRLKHIWSKDPQGTLTFQNLQSVKAVSCLNLQTLFPASVALGLWQLQKLELIGCGIEQVVAFGEDTEVPRFLFSNLSSLGLWYLPRVKYFYPLKHKIEWPMLKKFSAFHCEGVKETNAESLGKFPVQLPLFSIQKVIPRLEKLSLTSDDIAMICNGQFQGDIFSKVRVLRVLCYHDESLVFPIFFLERFCNLEKLQITCCNFKELLPSVASIDCQKKDVGRDLRIRKLKLTVLSHLKYIWSKDSGLSLFQNVESLKVEQCDSLVSISESNASFRNLTTLSVYRCQVLRNLFSFTTAQSLAQLQAMTVSECHLLTEIVGDEGDGLEDVVVFSKLKVLELKSLTRLASFCLGNFTFKFPLLEQVTVIQCPNFETFCHGVLKTPRLQRIQLTDGEDLGRPVVELNNTINHLYREMV